MEIIKGKTMEDAYIKAIREVMVFGKETSPRGSKTKEIAPATIVIEDARRFLSAPPARKINPCFGVAETLWFLRGSDDLEEIAHYNSVWRYFEDCDAKGKLNGAYGKRLRDWNGIDQLTEIYEKLKKDPDTRQAIAIIFDPERDNKIRCHGGYSKDIPCTSYFNFQIRDGKLNMHVVMRSNDLHKGFIYDAHNFMLIQNIIAGWLNIEVGKYTHTASSLHIYENDYANMWDILDEYEKEGKSVYNNTSRLLNISVEKSEFDDIMERLKCIDANCRFLFNSFKSGRQINYLDTFETTAKSVEFIENEVWANVGYMIVVYNMRKCKISKDVWGKIVEEKINSEYRQLFLNLSDLNK